MFAPILATGCAHSHSSYSGATSLTSMYPFEGVEEADQEIHEHSQLEGDATPHRHVS